MRTVSIPREQIFQGPLVLVNRAHPLHEKERSALTSVDPHHPGILLESRARQLLSACIQKAGGQREIVPVSGWRSQQEQQRIWDDSMAEHGETFTRQYVALPGCSEHQTGLAIDLGKAAGYIDFIRPAFPYDGVCGRFRRLAARYGFIERYQRGKEEVTGISAEPWHFRYVGGAPRPADGNQRAVSGGVPGLFAAGSPERRSGKRPHGPGVLCARRRSRHRGGSAGGLLPDIRRQCGGIYPDMVGGYP